MAHGKQSKLESAQFRGPGILAGHRGSAGHLFPGGTVSAAAQAAGRRKTEAATPRPRHPGHDPAGTARGSEPGQGHDRGRDRLCRRFRRGSGQHPSHSVHGRRLSDRLGHPVPGDRLLPGRPGPDLGGHPAQQAGQALPQISGPHRQAGERVHQPGSSSATRGCRNRPSRRSRRRSPRRRSPWT